MPAEAPATPVKSMLAKAAETLPMNTSPFVGQPADVSNGSRKASHAQDAGTASPIPARSNKNAGVAQPHSVAEDGEEQGEAAAKKRVRTRPKKKGVAQVQTSSDPPAVMNVEVSRNGNDMNGAVKRGKGWRQTPLLQPSPQPGSPADPASAKKTTRRQREHEREASNNGWATENATDVQDMDDFDFEASNKRFDKKGVFDQLKQDDTTADEDRLAGHNRIARPGTYGGKNLHPTENVLSPKLGPKYNSHEADSDADTELNFGNGRSSSRHSMTRSVLGKKQPSRQNSGQVDPGKPFPLTASMSSDRGGLARSATSLARSAGRAVPSVATSSPRPDRGPSPPAAKKAADLSDSAQEPRFVIQQTLSTCPVLLPNALETLETETVNRYGLTHDAVTESAARCIAEIAMTMFDPFGGSRRGSRANTVRGNMTSSMLVDRSQPPVIVILAGNHAVGARAVAAARHFVTRKCNIIVAEALYESSETRDPPSRIQAAMLRRMQRGEANTNIQRGSWRKVSNYIKNLAGPPAIIIDALLAGSTFAALADTTSNSQHAAASQQETREMIDWANRSRAPVLSIACPSGVSGLDGSATIVEGEPLAVRPDKILSLGAPMVGLLEAMKSGEGWEVKLADIGVNIALRSEEAVAFGASWVVDLRFVEDEGVRGVEVA
jgi:enhancer of mRNA-decapping protein 3